MNQNYKIQITKALRESNLDDEVIMTVLASINHCEKLVKKLDKSFIEHVGLIVAGILRGEE